MTNKRTINILLTVLIALAFRRHRSAGNDIFVDKEQLTIGLFSYNTTATNINMPDIFISNVFLSY